MKLSTIETGKDNTGPDFPPLDYDVVVALYDKFKSKIKSTVNTAIYTRDKEGGTGTSRELVKNVSDVVWNSLSRSYMTNSPHIQSLYTYLTGTS
jgi:menin